MTRLWKDRRDDVHSAKRINNNTAQVLRAPEFRLMVACYLPGRDMFRAVVRPWRASNQEEVHGELLVLPFQNSQTTE